MSQRMAIFDLGRRMGAGVTAHEAIVAGNLDWTVSVRPIRTVDGLDVPSHFATVRDDVSRPLGIVKRRYTPVQNVEIADFLSSLFGRTSAVIEVVGSTGMGERVFFLAKIPSATFEAKPGDPTEAYFLCTSTHDGSGSVAIAFTPIRVACTNVLSAALRRAHQAVYVKHTRNVARGLNAAARIVAEGESYWTRFREASQAMARQDMNRDDVAAALRSILPDSIDENGNIVPTAHVLAAREKVAALFEGEGAGADVAGRTRYGLFNAVVEYAERHRPVRGTTNRIEASLFNEGAAGQLRQRAFDLLAA